MLSSIGAAVDNLTALIASAIPAELAGAPVSVVFGPLAEYVAPVTLQVLEVTGDQQPAEIGRDYRREETYTIVCEIVTWSGDQDYGQRFRDALSCWNAVLGAVGDNPYLSASGVNDASAAVRYAEVGNMSIIPDTDTAGQSRCSLQFHVRCSARVNSLASYAA